MDKYEVFLSFLMLVTVMIIIIVGIINDGRNDEINNNCCACRNECIKDGDKE